jgi:opacity protein-like surface antigen
MISTRTILALALAASALPATAQAPAAAKPEAAAPAAAPAPKAAPAPAAAAADYVPTGEIRIRLSASFDGTRVRGPNTNLTLTSDGAWGGTIAGKAVRLTVTPTRITGGGVSLNVTREGDRLSVQGTAASGARVRIIVTKTTMDLQAGKRTFNATRADDGSWRQANMAGGPTNFRFTGAAADPLAAPMPQWVLAAIAAL